MDIPPSSSRQPPDGHEFPDCHEGRVILNAAMALPPNKATTNRSHNLWNTSPTCAFFEDKQSSCSVRDKIAIFSNSSANQSPISTLRKLNRSTDDIPAPTDSDAVILRCQLNKVQRSLSTSCKSDTSDTCINNLKSNCNLRNDGRANHRIRSSLDLTLKMPHSRCMSEEKFDDLGQSYAAPPRLHTRSQSLMDISSTESPQKKDRWSLLAEHRQRSLSKLKGLVIPERVLELDTPAVLDLPEIKSSVTASISDTSNMSVPTDLPNYACQRDQYVPLSTSSPWTENFISNIPKYSPTFKRKSLQFNPESVTTMETCTKPTINKISTEFSCLQTLDYKKSHVKQNQSDFYDTTKNGNQLNDAPKSLESITSPTRSDYSFDYVSSPEIKITKKQDSKYTNQDFFKNRKEIRKSDEDSDNDSAMSSSQSSFASRTTPPASPNNLYTNFDTSSQVDSLSQLKTDDVDFHSDSNDSQNHRLLKAQSVEAKNRQNIIASAKCSSGKDLKIGSPLIQRRFVDQETQPLQNGPTNSNPNQKVFITKREYFVDSIKEIEQVCDNLKIHVDSAKIEPEQIEIKEVSAKFEESQISSKTGNQKKYDDDNDKYVQDFKLNKSLPSPIVNNLKRSFERSISLPTNENSSKAVLKSSAIEHQKPKTLPIFIEPPNSQNVIKKIVEVEDIGAIEESITLRPEIPGGSVGVTLAGGSDYETKEITVHKIRDDSSAHRDGRLRKGDVILSINGKSVNGLTHKQLVLLLKEPVPEVTLTVSKSKGSDHVTTPTSPYSPSTKTLDRSISKDISNTSSNHSKLYLVSLMKDISGLGLSLEGGQDSLLGDKPLLIKKIFKGGAAEKSGKLQVGDEIVNINETNVSLMSRLEAWSILKKLPENITISLTIRRSNMP
ncbi:hypothetical protein FQA39_LY07224 [Lamprigera yunnana]|nr:hypothetical protein FQA39_LY07224 [Lamprigera yunnana]